MNRTETNSDTKAEKATASAPGEGERRAQRGYVRQYDLGARVIYEALAAGSLEWVGVADRGAGAFDDIVLGLRDRIAAYQVKASRDPEPFSIRTVLLGAEKLWARMLESRSELGAKHRDTPIETIYVCDDYPRPNDKIGNTEQSFSSAAFLHAHEAHRRSWTLADWRASASADLIADLQAACGLDDDAFEVAWQNTCFIVGGQSRRLTVGDSSSMDEQRLQDISALLPRLVADPADRDRWTVADVLLRLGWHDPFKPRHSHTFPVDALYQTNPPTQEALQRVLSNITSGYVSLVGPPGSGKSTLLAAGLMPPARAGVVRYLAFVPDEEQGLGRAEAFDFLHDIVKQLKDQGLGNRTMPGSELPELRRQLEALLLEASNRFQNEGVCTVIVVDGLDHIPREERPRDSFLGAMPLPHAVPDGVVFVLGTQRLDLEGLLPAVSDQAMQSDRCIEVMPLSREAVSRLAIAARVPDDVDRDELFDRTAGHPLSTRYVIEGLLNANTPEDRQYWLRHGPADGGDVNAFYQRTWHDLQRQPKAQEALAYLALAEGPLSPNSVEALVGRDAADAAWRAAKHLLVRDHRKAWSIFHNSFRLFLRQRTGLRYEVYDEVAVRQRYLELANMARSADPTDPQRWMELRYRARAGDHAAVADLATPERFRVQFFEGRSPGDVHNDIGFAFASAGVLRNAALVVNLILSGHEINMRCYALGDEVFDTLVQLGERRAALGLLEAESVWLTAGKGYELVDAFLKAGEIAEARKLFHNLEPIDKLLGSEPLAPWEEDDELFGWAEQALVFREPAEIMECLARLRVRNMPSSPQFDIEGYRAQLKLVAVRGQIKRHPDLAPMQLIDALEIRSEQLGLLLCFAARAAFEADSGALALQHLEAALALAGELGPDVGQESAVIAAWAGRLELAADFLDDAPPTLVGRDLSYHGDDLKRASRHIITHAELTALLGRPFAAGAAPESSLLANYQTRLEILGRLLGEGRAGRPPFVEPLQAFRATLEFLEHAEGDRPNDWERRHLDEVMDEVVAKMVDAAAALGPESLARFTEALDARLAARPRRLDRPSVHHAYAMAVFRHEHDAGRGAQRLAYVPGPEQTPAEQIAEAARAASAFAALGLGERAREILTKMHEDGLGYSRPARKDPQYRGWRDLLVRACDEDPEGRQGRLRFFARLLFGLAKTEGNDAGRRLMPAFLDQAAQAGPAWARAASDHAEETGLASWPVLVAGLLIGLVKRDPELTAAAGVIFGRVALPFVTEQGKSIYPELIRAAPHSQLEMVVRHALICVETDAHAARRIILLEEIVDAAADRGFPDGGDALARWRSELPRPRSGSSPEDPFFLVRSLEELINVLQQAKDTSTAWGAVQAFERIAPAADYDAAKKVFDSVEMLNQDEDVIDAMAQAAIAAGRQADAMSCLARLKQAAEHDGSWGSAWRKDTKQSYHRLNVKLGGEAASSVAFDCFVDDLAHRREPVDVISDLGNILELLSPRPEWEEAWACLQQHLSEFREYRLGQELKLPTESPDGQEHILADILFRAIDTTAVALANMARTAAVELARIPGGPAVLAALLPRLWQEGGHHALEASQIAWECRDALAVRDAASPILPAMCESEDYAVRRIAVNLARGCGQQVRSRRKELSAVYHLELPPNPQAGRFEPPAGTSSVSSGLYTEDAYAWTWPLEDALQIMARATGLDLANLRARAAQLMTRIGGTEAFGPEAVARQNRRLKRLRLEVGYRRQRNGAAFQAMREVLGELEAAEAIDPQAARSILLQTFAFAGGVTTVPPAPRPYGVPMTEMADPYGAAASTDWRASAKNDAIRPIVEGFVVLASTAVHKRRRFQDEWIVEQYSGPDVGPADDGLSTQLGQLPWVIIADAIDPLYDGIAQGAVVHPARGRSLSLVPHMIMLCPRVAAAVGWHPDPRHVFNYLDEGGRLTATTLYWRDGGEQSSPSDVRVVRHGYVLMAREDCAEKIHPYMATAQLSRAWRVTQNNEERSRDVICGSRIEPMR